MTASNWLFMLAISLIAITIYILLTCPVSKEDIDEMLNDEDLWP